MKAFRFEFIDRSGKDNALVTGIANFSGFANAMLRAGVSNFTQLRENFKVLKNMRFNEQQCFRGANSNETVDVVCFDSDKANTFGEIEYILDSLQKQIPRFTYSMGERNNHNARMKGTIKINTKHCTYSADLCLNKLTITVKSKNTKGETVCKPVSVHILGKDNMCLDKAAEEMKNKLNSTKRAHTDFVDIVNKIVALISSNQPGEVSVYKDSNWSVDFKIDQTGNKCMMCTKEDARRTGTDRVKQTFIHCIPGTESGFVTDFQLKSSVEKRVRTVIKGMNIVGCTV